MLIVEARCYLKKQRGLRFESDMVMVAAVKTVRFDNRNIFYLNFSNQTIFFVFYFFSSISSPPLLPPSPTAPPHHHPAPPPPASSSSFLIGVPVFRTLLPERSEIVLMAF